MQTLLAQLVLEGTGDVPGDASTTIDLALGDHLIGNLFEPFERDWFRIELQAGQTLAIVMNGYGDDPAPDPMVRLRDSDGNIVASNDDYEGLNARIDFTVTEAGVYYIDAGTRGSYSTGDYELIVFDPLSQEDTIAASSATTAQAIDGTTFHGVIEEGSDTDWIAIDLAQSETTIFRIEGSGGDPLADSGLRLRSPDGAILAVEESGGQLILTAAETGTYYIEAYSIGGANSGEYRIHVDTHQVEAPWSYAAIGENLLRTLGDGYMRFDVGDDGELTVYLAAMASDSQAYARAALDAWSSVTGIVFREVGSLEAAELRLQDDGEGAWAALDNGSEYTLTATVNVPATALPDSYTLDSWSYLAFLHEIGHALGLDHTGNYNGGGVSYATDALYANDSRATSVMSYFNQETSTYFADLGFSLATPLTPMLGDVAAMAMLYGLSTGTRTGNTVYGFGSTAGAAFDAAEYALNAYAIFDNGGWDTLDYSQSAADQYIDLRPEIFMNVLGLTGNVIIASGTVIERALGGSGADLINGNWYANVLSGNDGDDIVSGLGGDDVIAGGTGADRLNGGFGNDQIHGGSGDDVLHGEQGNDALYGWDGIDFIAGGEGNDVIFGGEKRDNLQGGEGDDTVSGDAGWDLLMGGAGNDRLDGGGGDDKLVGEDGADRLIGGAGHDLLIGGGGADVFVIDSAAAADVDTISDFTCGEDRIELDQSVFLPAATQLWASNFVVASAAQDWSDRLVYDAASGELFYDPDGIGAEAQVLIAQLQPGLALTVADFVLAPSQPLAMMPAEDLATGWVA